MTEYNVDYFIKKFEAIPNDKWCLRVLQDSEGRSCAFGHCGTIEGKGRTYIHTKEGNALEGMFDSLEESVVQVSDGINSEYDQITPRGRMLAALKHIKECIHR